MSRGEMEADIRAGRYLEHGEYEGNLYGTRIDSIRGVVASGKVCVLDVNPQVLSSSSLPCPSVSSAHSLLPSATPVWLIVLMFPSTMARHLAFADFLDSSPSLLQFVSSYLSFSGPRSQNPRHPKHPLSGAHPVTHTCEDMAPTSSLPAGGEGPEDS